MVGVLDGGNTTGMRFEECLFSEFIIFDPFFHFLQTNSIIFCLKMLSVNGSMKNKV